MERVRTDSKFTGGGDFTKELLLIFDVDYVTRNYNRS